MFMEIKDVQAIKTKLSESKKFLMMIRDIFTCLICKEVMTETSGTVMLPCCRNALCCDCLSRWLADSSVCPHCREEVQLENSLPQPLIRPIIDMLHDWSSLVKCTKTVLHYIAYLLTQSFIHDLSFTIDGRWFWLPTPRSLIHYPNIKTAWIQRIWIWWIQVWSKLCAHN